MSVRSESLNDQTSTNCYSSAQDASDAHSEELQVNPGHTNLSQKEEKINHSQSEDTIKTNSKTNDSSQITITKSRGIKSQVNFDQNMNYDSICVCLIKVFLNNYESACENDSIISDYLSVRELRTIVKTLKLCDGSDIFNHRKPSLCQMVQAFISSDEMKIRHKKYFEERERVAKIRAEKKLERQKALERENRIATPKKTIKSKEAPINTKGKDQQREEFKEPAKEKSMPVIITPLQVPTPSLNIYPKTVADSSKALEVLKTFNGIVWELSARITELERAASMLLIKISEAEKNI